MQRQCKPIMFLTSKPVLFRPGICGFYFFFLIYRELNRSPKAFKFTICIKDTTTVLFLQVFFVIFTNIFAEVVSCEYSGT